MRAQAFYRRFGRLLALRWLAGMAARDREVAGPDCVVDPHAFALGDEGPLPGDVMVVGEDDGRLRERCQAAGMPLFLSPHAPERWRRVVAMHWPWVWMSAPWGVHGTFVNVLGCGVLLTGDAGVGKSDLALSLIARGHSLVADDGPEIHVCGHCGLVGRCPDGFEGRMEVRGLGIVDVTELFGPDAHLPAWPLHLVLRLAPSSLSPDAERHELCYGGYTLGGRSVPVIDLPVGRGREMGLVAETAVRLHRARQLRGSRDMARIVSH